MKYSQAPQNGFFTLINSETFPEKLLFWSKEDEWTERIDEAVHYTDGGELDEACISMSAKDVYDFQPVLVQITDSKKNPDGTYKIRTTVTTLEKSSNDED